MADSHRRFRLVVADSSALVALAACHGLPWLDRLANEIFAPEAVLREVTVDGKPHAETLSRYLDGKVQSVRKEDFVIEAGSLGLGEVEAMALYKLRGADALLIDDDRARKIAKLNGIEVVGSLGVLLLAKHRGWIPTIETSLERLRASELFFHEALLAKAKALAGE